MNNLTVRDRIGLFFLKLGALITSSTKINFQVGDNTYQCIMYVPKHSRRATKTETTEYWAEKRKRVNELNEDFVVIDVNDRFDANDPFIAKLP